MNFTTEEQKNIYEAFSEEQRDVFAWILENHTSNVEDALWIVEDETYEIWESVRQLVDIYTSDCGYNVEDLPAWISVDYEDAWYGSFKYDYDFFDEPAGYEGADQYGSGESRQLWEEKTDWQIENSRVIHIWEN